MDAVTEIRVRALLFDMDGTLVNSQAAVDRIWGNFADRFGLDVAHVLAGSHGVRMVETVTRHAPAGTDIDGLVDELTVIERNDSDGIVEVPGAGAFIAGLPADRVALVTSATRQLADIRMQLTSIAILGVVVTAEDVPRGKPAPDPYLLAAERLGIDPADAVVFEDAEAGIVSAQAAGCSVIVVGDLDTDITHGLPRIADYQQISASFDGDWITLTL
jgi:sugar-phosphatase